MTCQKLQGELLGKMALLLGTVWPQSLYFKLGTTQRRVGGPASSASPGRLLECSIFGPTPDLLNQNL